MSKKALIVEDSRFFRQVIKNKLAEELGVEALSAATLAEARAILSSEASDILVALLDINLPDAPNGEIVDEVVPFGIPSIVFTGTFSDEIREFVLSRNVVDYITKDSRESLDTVVGLVRRISLNAQCHILVVDDSKVSRRHVSNLLQQHRFQVTEAANAEEALAILQRCPDITLAIVDYNMPEIDGVELTRRLRAEKGRHKLIVIGLSAYGNNVVSARFMKAGANDYLNKPFVPEELFCRIYHNLDLVEHIAYLRKANQALAKANDEKSRFLGHLNHELCNPLNAILGFTEILLTDRLCQDERGLRYLHNIQRAGQHMRDLTLDALDMARIEAGRLDLEMVEINLGQLCQEALSLLSPMAETAKLDMRCTGAGAVIQGDRRRLRQVALNLISNAVKFTPPGGRIIVETGRQPDGAAFFAVEDTGCGMDETGIAKALAPFGQLGDAESKSKGTGLGLPLSKSLIEHHGGTLLVESQPGVGTRVSAIFPPAGLIR